MYRGSTPLHTFTFPFDIGDLSEIIITYNQKGNNVLEKRKEDLDISGNVASFRLTQEESYIFDPLNRVKIQVKILTGDGIVEFSDMVYTSVKEVLNTEILGEEP